jgi:hypothetical protein
MNKSKAPPVGPEHETGSADTLADLVELLVDALQRALH